MKGALAAACVAVALAPASPAAATAHPTSVRVDPAEIATKLGHRFSFRSTIRNTGSKRLSGVIAHLNVLSYDPGTYVDPRTGRRNAPSTSRASRRTRRGRSRGTCRR